MAKFGPGRTIASYAWALSPLYTFGLGTPIAFALAAHAQESARLWVAQFPYLVLTVTGFACTQAEDGSTVRDVGAVALVLSMVGGTVHALFLRRRAFRPLEPPPPIEPAELERRRKDQRRSASLMTRTGPATARELRIGRPDLPRTYEDGGLVDLNHVPASFIAEVPGITPDLAERIVAERERCGGFDSVEEVVARAKLPAELTPVLGEYGVFLSSS